MLLMAASVTAWMSFETLGFVLGELRLLGGFDGIAADVADVDAAFFGEAVRGLHEFLAALAAHLRERDADDFAVRDGVHAEVGFLNALEDRLGERGVPRLDLDEAGVRALEMAAHCFSGVIEP